MALNDFYHHYRYYQNLVKAGIRNFGVSVPVPRTAERKKFMVLSYPKCGRTWLRYMINLAEAEAYKIPLRNTVHGIRYGQYNLPRGGYTHGFRVEKRLCDFHVEIAINSRMQGVVFLARDPVRVMISYYHQKVYREGAFKGTISEFIRNENLGIVKYAEFIDYYLPKVKAVPNKVVLYEDLKTHTMSSVADVLEFMGIDLSQAAVARVVQNASFDKMAELEKSNEFKLWWFREGASGDPRGRKVRTGGEDRISEHLFESDLEFIRDICAGSKNLRELGYYE